MQTATIGDNSGAVPLETRLAETYAFDAPIEEFGAKALALPKTFTADEHATLAGDVVKEGRALLKRIETARVDEGEPYLKTKRAIDAYFASLADRIEKTNQIIVIRANDYQRAKAAEARRIAEEEARKAREEAERQRKAAEEAAAANRLAAASKAEGKADVAEERARRAETVAETSVADLTRVRSSTGTVVSAKTEFTFRIVDWDRIDLSTLRTFIKRDAIEAAIRSLMKVQGRSVQLDGVEFFEDVKANIR